MADKSDKYISKFKPKSHFFTDPSAVSQVAPQAFGPGVTDEFRLTSKFTITAGKAFAICKSVVLVQPQTGNDNKVNLILRPYTQPISGLNIKYFIYRGLNKSDFFADEKVIAPTTDTSDFINKINASFVSFHTNTDPGEEIPDFLSRFIGYDPAKQADDLMLDDFFFKQSEYVESDGEFEEKGETAYELPLIEMGASLGNFVTGECGIDIVFSYGDYKLPAINDEFTFDLAYARSTEAIIDVSGITDAFQKKLKREQIFQFIDAAAYFGFHCIEGGAVTTDSNGTKVDKKGDDIYNDVVSKFFTKNNLYLYIQSDRTRSYNFYDNYKIDDAGVNSLRLGITESGLTDKPYNTAGWPIIIDSDTQAGGDDDNKLYLQFVTDNNVNSMLYGQVAQIDNAEHNNFCGPDDLKLPVDPVIPVDTDTTANLLTKIVVLSNPAAGPDNAKLKVATFNILLYEGKMYNYVVGQVTDDNGGATNLLAQANFFDDVFDLINATPLLTTSGNTNYSTLSSQKVKLINHYYDKTQYGVSAVQTVIVNDVIDTTVEETPTVQRITYITESIDILTSVNSLTGTVSSDTKSYPSVSGTVVPSKTYELPNPFYYTLKEFTDSMQLINGLILNTQDASKPGKIIMGLSINENDLLKDLIKADNLVNARLFLVDLFVDGVQLVSDEDILYQKYKVGIVGEVTGNELKLSLPATDIIVYSIDRQYHFSDEYSKYVKDDVQLTLVLDLDLSI